MTPFSSHRPFTSAHGRATAVKILLIVGAVATGLSLFVEAVSLALPPPTPFQQLEGNPLAAAIAFIALLLGVIESGIYLTTAVFFLVWLYRAYDNLRAFASHHVNYSPGWVVGSFFVPIINLFVPYSAVKELWQKSEPPAEAFLSAPDPPASLPVWWLFWLLSSVGNNIALRVSFDANVEQSTATQVSIIASALSIIAACLAYLVVDAIDKRQEETCKRLGLGRFAAPPSPPAYM